MPAAEGDHCRECTFDWAAGPDALIALVAGLPDAFREVTSGARGEETHPSLGWSVGSYVCHVADNLRIWAERLAGVTAGADRLVAPYDENALAAARRYGAIPLVAGLWSLERSSADWCAVVTRSPKQGVVLVHPERGALSLVDVAQANAHDGWHHRGDVARILAADGV